MQASYVRMHEQRLLMTWLQRKNTFWKASCIFWKSASVWKLVAMVLAVMTT